MRKIVPVIVFLALIAGAVLYFDVFDSGAAGDFVEASGTIETTEIILTPKISGRIERVAFEEGSAVRKGDIVARIAYDELDAQKLSARSNLENARTNFLRIQGLYEKNSVSRQLYDNARNTYQNARSQNLLLDAQIANALLNSPIDGTLLKRYMEPGELAMPGSPVASVADLENLWIKVYLTTIEIASIKLGDVADLTIDGSDKKFEAEVVSISDKAEFTPKTIMTKKERVKTVFAVKLKLRSAGGVLKPGMPADVVFRKR